MENKKKHVLAKGKVPCYKLFEGQTAMVLV